MAFNPSLLLWRWVVVEVLPSGPSEGRIALTEDDLALLKVAKDGFGLTSGDTGESSSVGATATSFSSKNTGTLFSEVVVLTLLLLATCFARFPRVGTRGPEPAFLISTGRAVTFLATIELLLLPNLPPCCMAGDRVFPEPDGIVDPDLTLTMLA